MSLSVTLLLPFGASEPSREWGQLPSWSRAGCIPLTSVAVEAEDETTICLNPVIPIFSPGLQQKNFLHYLITQFTELEANPSVVYVFLVPFVKTA